ncbi:glycoside hydrolase superfamily, partial [Limtongia smithiae]|uniref:glycoside hydrolase superfamily n=1 Tax=Limtongia smithiae TaxID=1125753 RepID=UPI0034CF533A
MTDDIMTTELQEQSARQAESPREPTEENATVLQAFEWYIPDDGQHWNNLKKNLKEYKDIGITAMWIPPPCKASTPSGNGYDIYDLWDLGEFDQKGLRATKWGSKEDLDSFANAAKYTGMLLYMDVVLNHKAAADKTERCMAVEVDPDGEFIADVSEPYEIEGWLGFDFPGRGDKYSALKWHWEHFTGTDYNAENEKTAIYRILGDNKSWATNVDKENGNFDYLMFADIDHAHPEVKEDINRWGLWVSKELSLRGMRFDAVKHFSEVYLGEFINHLKEHSNKDFFFVGEFWKDSLEDMLKYLDRMKTDKFSLFDAPLVYNFSEASRTEAYDLSKIFDGSLVQARPVNSVTLVMNHDTQPHQALAAPIEGFFKPIAYALILLRREGYPCVFWGDLEGIANPDYKEPPSCGGKLSDIILARSLYAYGDQHDYFDYPTCLGWVRRGTWDRSNGMAVVVSNAGPGEKKMFVGEEHAGQVWTDVLGWEPGEVTIDDDGFGLFKCPGVSIAIWVNKDAGGRDRFGKF